VLQNVILNNCLPSEKKTLGKDLLYRVFAECCFPALGKDRHSAKKRYFAECYFFALGQELLCRVLEKLYSANHLALGKELVSGSE
jgi:hypothetical protein